MTTILALFSWWLWLEIIGLAALPLAWRLFRPLPDRGYALSKPLGLLVWGYVFWLGASVGVLHNTLGGTLIAIAVLGLVAYLAGREGLRENDKGQRPLIAWLGGHRRHILISEALFLGAFLLWAFVRSRSPDIATAGGEKFMEITFINGVLTSRLFPPHDPWLAGYAISYYYFGYVMMAGLIRLAHVPSSVGFNIGFASWFALTVVAAYGVVGNLVGLGFSALQSKETTRALVRAEEERGGGFAVGWGVLGAVVLALMGNLEGFLEVLYARRLLPVGFWQWLDIRNINKPYDPSIPASWIPQRFIWWWQASRVIHDRDLVGNTMEVIDEFPAFSFILGDMHPHVLGLPFVILVIGLALALFLRGGEVDEGPRSWLAHRLLRLTNRLMPPLDVVFYALALGGLAFLNTWDFPIYLALVTGVMAVVSVRRRGFFSWNAIQRAVVGGGTLAVLGVLFYLPFYIGFQSQAGGLLPNLFNPTRLPQFFVMFGPLLLTVVIFLLLQGRPAEWREFGRWLGALWLLPWAATIVLVAGYFVTPGGREFLDSIFANPVVQENVGGRSIGQLLLFIALRRVRNPWTFLLLGGLLAWAATLLLSRLRGQESTKPHSSDVDLRFSTFPLLLVVLGLLLTYAVEFVYIKDLFGTRMNTVFKFYFQAWVLWSIAGTYALALVTRGTRKGWRSVALGLSGVLMALGLVYTILAIPARSELGQVGPTLDGEAWVAQAFPNDYAVIRWVREHVPEEAIVLEATGGSYSFFGRVSAFTGRATLFGWDFHEWQWRGPEALQQQAGSRGADIERVYREARGPELLDILHRYNVIYVVLASQERQKYGVGPEREKEFDRTLDKVFEEGDARVYKVP